MPAVATRLALAVARVTGHSRVEPRGCFGASPDSKLVEDVLQVVANRVRRDPQHLCDLCVGATGRDRFEDLELPSCEEAKLTRFRMSPAAVEDQVRSEQYEQLAFPLGQPPAFTVEEEEPYFSRRSRKKQFRCLYESEWS